MIKGDKIVLRSVEREDLEKIYSLNKDKRIISPLIKNNLSPSLAEMISLFGRNQLSELVATTKENKFLCNIKVEYGYAAERKILVLFNIYEEKMLFTREFEEVCYLLLTYFFYWKEYFKITTYVLESQKEELDYFKNAGFREEGLLREQIF